MEVWALYAYGASNVLQEILTVKSDDRVGRVKSYEAIVKGENIPAAQVPESFKVLVKEMKSLCLDVELETHDSKVSSSVEEAVEVNPAVEKEDSLFGSLTPSVKQQDDSQDLLGASYDKLGIDSEASSNIINESGAALIGKKVSLLDDDFPLDLLGGTLPADDQLLKGGER